MHCNIVAPQKTTAPLIIVKIKLRIKNRITFCWYERYLKLNEIPFLLHIDLFQNYSQDV